MRNMTKQVRAKQEGCPVHDISNCNKPEIVRGNTSTSGKLVTEKLLVHMRSPVLHGEGRPKG